MNIFTVSADVDECAQMLDDVRLKKMIVETSQMLSTSMRQMHGERGILRRWCGKGILHKDCMWFERSSPHSSVYNQRIDLSAYVNHPCTIWARADYTHFMWLAKLFIAMLTEHEWRGFTPHKCNNRLPWLSVYVKTYVPPKLGLPDYWPNCSPYKDLPPFEAYRTTMIEKWTNDTIKLTWTRRGQPSWSIGYIEPSSMH